MCGMNVLKKIRRKISYGGHVWEVDFFEGRHKGLILAEAELKSPDEFLELPAWILKEVSADPRYFNSNLVKNKYPFGRRNIKRRRPRRKKFF